MIGQRLALRSRTPRTPEPADRRPRHIGRILAILTALATAVAALIATPLSASAATSGTLSIAPGKSASANVTGSSLGDVVGSATFTVPAQRTAYVAVQFRAPSASTGYRTKARVLSDGTVSVSVSRVSGGAESILVSATNGLKVSTGQKLNVEGQVTGTSPVQISVRAWVDGTTKPGWQQTYSDNSGSKITAAGAVQLWGYLDSAAGSTANIAFASATAAATGGSGSTTGGTAATTGGKPSDATTGVPSGTSLKRYDGDLTITTAGTVIDGMDIHGFVTVKAANVTIKNSIVRGGKSKGYAVGLITNYGYDNLVIDHVDVVAEYPSVYFDGIKGWDFTAKYVHVVGNVDSVKIHGDNVSIQNSLLENTTYYSSDPAQSGGPTHNDNVQILKGSNLSITGNTIRGATNFAILGGAEQANVNLKVNGNWLDGGHCTVKLQVKNGWSETATVTNNKFGPNRAVSSCPFTAFPAVKLTQSGNTMELTGAVVNPLIVVS
ncbi:right-handed parallel beta-helix repeat-containing protein [Microlunatus ginsengisoli]|uniref:Right handed beta helix region n=1 Tax=Microlunatus ginsengisoli TaxID=363863 RepID=A0ABP6ZGP9_9ACTN